MVEGNGENQFRQYVGQNVRNQNGYNAVHNVGNHVVQNEIQNPGVQNVRNQNGLFVVLVIANQNLIGNGNVVAARAEVRLRRRDAAYLQTQLLIAQKEEVGIQLQAKEFDLMAAVMDLDEIEEVNANYILMANLQQASTSDTQSDKAPVYDSDGSAEVHLNDNCYNVEIFNMFTQKDHYTELLEPIPELHHVKQNNSNVISEVTSVEQEGGTVEQHSATVEETHAYHELFFHNLDAEVMKVNSVNRKMKETNAELTTELARYNNQEKCFEISQEKYDKLERCYQKSVYQEQVAKFVQDLKSLEKEADESLAKHKALELEIKRLLRAVVSQDIMSIVQSNSVVDTSNLQTELERMKERFENSYNDMQQKIKRLESQLGDQKGKSSDTPCVSNTLDPLSQKLENENVELEFQIRNYAKENAHLKAVYKNLFDSINLRARLFDKISEQKDTTKGTSENTKFANQTNLGKPSLRPLRNHSVIRQPNAFQSERPKRVPPKVLESNDLSKSVTSNSVPTTKESTVMENDKVIAPRMFRIDPCTTYRGDKFVPINNVKASIRTNPITASQPHVITKKVVNSDSNGFSSTGVDITTKSRRPQPRSNTKNDRVLSASQNSCIKNKEVKVEEHRRNLLLSKNKKHMSSEYNNVKLAIQNDKSEVVCVMCKQCLIIANHDVCVLNYVNGMNRVVIQICLWCVDSGCSKHMIGNLKLPINFVRKFLGTVRFGNDHVAAILGFGDLQWVNNSITKVYFVEGLGHNLFSVGQFCDSDLEVAFRRNTCFVINLKGVDLLKTKRTTNLYTINLHDMASASPICLMARATSTKSWLWHQRPSHLNFDTINDLSKNDLVTGLLKFKYHKEYLCPSCEQRKSKRASHPPKPVPNSKQRLHLLLMDLCGPMRIESINGKRYVLQNGVVERRNCTLVEAARTMLIFSRAPLFLWAEAIAIAALCYLKIDREDIGKLGAKGDIGFFIGYSADSCAYRVYNQRTKKTMNTMNVTFEELSAMALNKAVQNPGFKA
ncbi:retrovirus-related pol polyprotein from transposon TNT 1-94 [Tanacetum coccineum]